MQLRGLYAILDLETLQARRVDPIAFARAVLRARPAALQVRSKASPLRETLGLLRELQPLCRQAGVPLVANDQAELATLASCDMLHVGQTDEPIARVRRRFPGLPVGVSTHSLRQLDTALAERPAYVACGPVFSTQTKLCAGAAIGVSELAEARTQAAAVGIPLVAIGGITRSRAPQLVGTADAVAVISDLLPRGPASSSGTGAWFRCVTERARALHEMFTSDDPTVRRHAS
jgi:thiamine-phosphate pyrophosphorylase